MEHQNPLIHDAAGLAGREGEDQFRSSSLISGTASERWTMGSCTSSVAFSLYVERVSSN